MNRAETWREQGGWFTWAPSAGGAADVEVFHVEVGDASLPPLVLVHGFPTSSIDWVDVAERQPPSPAAKSSGDTWSRKSLNFSTTSSVSSTSCSNSIADSEMTSSAA